MNFTQSELQEQDIAFSNAHNMDQESFEIEVCDRRSESSGANFHLWINGHLAATFQTFFGLQSRANALISGHNLQRVA